MQFPVFTDGTTITGDGTVESPLVASGGGGGAPGGADTDIQFNDGGAFGGDAALTYDKTTKTFVMQGDDTGFASFLYGPGHNTGWTADGITHQLNLNAGDPTGQLTFSAQDAILASLDPAATTGIDLACGPTGSMEIFLNIGSTLISIVNGEAVGPVLVQSNNADLNLNTAGGTVTMASGGSPVVRVTTDVGPALGFFAATPVVQPTITGSRASGAALADLLTQLALLGLIVDGTSA